MRAGGGGFLGAGAVGFGSLVVCPRRSVVASVRFGAVRTLAAGFFVAVGSFDGCDAVFAAGALDSEVPFFRPVRLDAGFRSPLFPCPVQVHPLPPGSVTQFQPSLALIVVAATSSSSDPAMRAGFLFRAGTCS